MFCYNLCSWFIKLFSHHRQERLSRQSCYPRKSNFYPLISLFFVFNLKVYNVDFLYLVLTKSRQFRWSHWMQRQMSGRLRSTVSCYKTSLDEGRSEPCGELSWVHQMDNLEIGRWPLSVSRVSLLQFVLLIHMLISGVSTKMFYLRREGEWRSGPKLLLDQRTPTSSSLKVTRGKKKVVSNKWCKRSQA